MAVLVLVNAQVLVNAVDLSDHVRQVTLNYKAELQDDTHMSDTTRERVPGLLDWDLSVDFNQDFAAAKVDATLFPLVGAAAFAVEVRPVAAARSATNPGYNGSAVLADYPILGQQVGALATTTVKFSAAGTLSRSTA